MDFRLLGPLEVVENGRPLALGAPKQRALLAVLLLHANEVVATERLIDELWGESPPATVNKSVQTYVSRLRKQLGDGRLVTHAPGYVLHVAASELDLARFEALVARAAGADPKAAARLLSEALALWRGPPLADLAFEPFAQAEIARLHEARVSALEQRLDADLAAGRHDELVGELEALVREHPLRERLRGQQMLCLYRAGRQAEALEAFRTARAVLVDELGIEPGRRLRDLHEAILRHDPALDLDRAPDRAFVGRGSELAALAGALEDALTGGGRVILLAGEPGIGKSRLTEELIAKARRRGARVLVGRCWEAGGAPAYWPWVQSLRSYVADRDRAALDVELGAAAPHVAQLLPELHELFPALEPPAAAESEGARFRLFDAVSAFLKRAARAVPLVIVLDDLHVADEPSLLLLRFVAREIADSRVLVVCAYRDVDPTLRDPLTAALAQLIRESHTRQIALIGLDAPDVGEYIERSAGIEPASELVRTIHTVTEGNPLFVVELIRLLGAEGRMSEPDAAIRIPPGVRAAIGQRLGRLSPRCRDTLAAASVLGREFELPVLARMSELVHGELLEVLDEAIDERVLGAAPGPPGRLRFGHALIRDTLYDALTAPRRLLLHERAGEALEAVHSADLEPHLSELAQQYLAAGVAGKAVAYARRAGEHAAAQLAFEEAARHYELALTIADDEVARCELLLALGDARARGGDTPASKRAFRDAAAVADAHGLPEQLARAALGYGGRIVWEVSRDDEHLAPLLERALAAIGTDDSPLRVRLLARLAGGPLRDSSFAPERKAALSAEALAMARRIGDRATLAYAVQGYILGQHSPDHTRTQLELSTELIGLAAQARDTERLVEGYEERLDALLELGDVRRAKLDLETMARLAEELRQPSQAWLVSVYRALFALLEGRFADAEELIAEARGLGERAQRWNAEVTYRLQLYLLRLHTGGLAGIEALIRRSADEYPTYTIWRCVVAHMAVSLGYTAEAEDAFDALAQDGFATVAFDEEWLVSLGFLAEVAAALSRTDAAAVLYAALLPYRDRVACSYPEISTGAVSRYLGLLAATLDRRDEAARHFEHALALHERIGARPWLERTRRDVARMEARAP